MAALAFTLAASTAHHMRSNSVSRFRSACESLRLCLDLLAQIGVVVMEGRDDFQSSDVTILVRLTPVI
jgi:hypothetical protein